MIAAGTALIILKKKKAALLVVALLAVPLTVLALKEIIININTTYEVRDLSGLRYHGYPMADYVNDLNNLKTSIEGMCIGNYITNTTNTERDNYFDFDIDFDATSENSMDVMLLYPNVDIGLKILTSVSIETDSETGDSRVVVGECTNNQDYDLEDFTYDGDTATKNQISEFAESELCPAFREVLESLDSECIHKLIRESMPED